LAAEPAVDKKIYVQVSRGVQLVRDHDFHGDEVPSVFAMCNPQSAPSESMLQNGIKLCTEQEIRWSNCHLKTISLLPNVLLKHAALEKGGVEALIVRDGRVVEGSSSNVFAVIEGRVHTPATSNEILPGITRSLLIALARELDLDVVEDELSLDSALGADEVWISSSTRGVIAVSSIDDQQVGNGKPGPVWEQMHQRYEAMVDELRNG
ncbi:MAG: aminotransferase class IV, partial [Pseudomonadota bacterium]